MQRRSSTPLWLQTAGRSLRYGRTRLGLLFTAAICAIAAIGPLVAPHSPNTFVGAPFEHASRTALLGTDSLGRDVLSRTLWGGWSVVWMATTATAIGLCVGVLVGLVAGYAKGRLDAILMALMDVALAFPQIVLVLLFIAFLGSNLLLIVLLVAFSHIPRVARLTRSVTLQASEQEFVQAAEALAVPRRSILLREVLPNLSTPLLVETGIRLTWSITLIASISFLGFGIQPPNADWGLMINENRIALVQAPWSVLAPALCIALFAVGTNLLTEGFSRAVARIGSDQVSS